MDELTIKVYSHLKSKAYFNSLKGEVILPTIRQTSESLKFDIEEVADCYQHLLELGIIEQYSEYQYVPGLQYVYTDKLKQQIKDYNHQLPV